MKIKDWDMERISMPVNTGTLSAPKWATKTYERHLYASHIIFPKAVVEDVEAYKASKEFAALDLKNFLTASHYDILAVKLLKYELPYSTFIVYRAI